MTLFGKSLGEYAKFTRIGIVLILLMGLARFTLGVSGVPYERATHLVSLTLLTLLLSLIYGQRAAAIGFGGYRHLLPAVFMLSGSMYGFIILAILLEGLGGIHGFFHAPGTGLQPPGMGVGFHIGGQLIAMLGATLIAWGLASLGFLLSRYFDYLRNAFLLLAVMCALRMAVGAAGVPYAIGTWVTSLTLLAMLLAVYYGYRAPSSGFIGYSSAALIGILIASAATLLVIYGIALSTSLMIANYFHAPGEGFQPVGMTVSQHIRGHLQVSVLGMVLLSLLAGIGFMVGKRKAAVTGQAAGQGVTP